MKRLFVIGLFLLLALAACHPKQDDSVETQNFASPQPAVSPKLQAVDSLLWQQPDSALALLLPWFDTVDSNETFDNHYAHLLLAELLYKNDYAQTNRTALLAAVAFFDSLVRQASPLKGGRGDSRHALNQKGNPAFLSARAHYINGVGYYEQDSVVEACREYLKALEVMEGRFEEKELVGDKARFMAYIYNRLGDLFEEQLLAESAITCYKHALFYCKREPTSIYGIPIVLYSIGIQFDVSGQTDSAYSYYDKALANMPDNDNIHYRDIMSTKALLAYYNFGVCSDSIIKDLKHIISLSANEDERTTRLLTLGNIMFDDKQYDSSLFYLETVFEKEENSQSKILAAENLCNIYQIVGDSLKVRQYASFLADYTMKEIEKKTDVSKVNEMFKGYLSKKQEKQAEIARKKAVKKAMEVFIPITIVVALVIFIIVKHRSKELLKEQQKEADRLFWETEQQHEEELRQKQAETEKILEERDKQHAEAIKIERQIHRMEQAAISGRLKRSNQEVRELKDQIKQLDDLSAKTETTVAFNEEPICRFIMERVHDGRFKSKIDCEFYKSYALDKQQLLDLRVAADRHFSQFTLRLRKSYPKLTNIDIDYCCLYLLNLTHADVSALMQRAYNTVVERDSKIQKILGSEKPLPVILMDIALNSSSV